MIGLFVSAVAVFVAYITVTLCRFGIPESISQTHYLWNDAIKNGGLLFTFMMLAVAFCILPPWFSVSPDNFKMLVFLAGAALAFVGCAAAFKEELTDSVHYTCAGIWAAMTILYSLLVDCYPFVIFAAVMSFIGIAANKWKNMTFWLECGAVLIMISTISFQLLTE